jgi:hypothetical protein
VEVPGFEGVIEMEGGDHDEFAPEILMLACGRATVPANPLTLLADRLNDAELPAVIL